MDDLLVLRDDFDRKLFDYHQQIAEQSYLNTEIETKLAQLTTSATIRLDNLPEDFKSELTALQLVYERYTGVVKNRELLFRAIDEMIRANLVLIEMLYFRKTLQETEKTLVAQFQMLTYYLGKLYEHV